MLQKEAGLSTELWDPASGTRSNIAAAAEPMLGRHMSEAKKDLCPKLLFSCFLAYSKICIRSAAAAQKSDDFLDGIPMRAPGFWRSPLRGWATDFFAFSWR